MNVERALATTGFMDPPELEYLAHAASISQTIVEVGSWKGRSTVCLAENTPGAVFSVDTWEGHLEHDAANGLDKEFLVDFLHNAKGLDNVYPIPITSVRAAGMFRLIGLKFDFIFIDASHDYENVCADIAVWRPLLKRGGILAGHDYGHDDWPGVKQAVDECVPKFRIVPKTSIWTTEAE